MKPKATPWNDWWKPVLLLVLLTILFVAAQLFHFGYQLKALGVWIKSLGAWGPIIFILIYTAAVVAILPVSLFAFMSGILFGTLEGSVVANIGATLGACLAFLTGRYFAREAVNHFLGKYEKFRELDQWTASKGALIVAVNRLFPLLPFNLVNYAFGLTKIDFWPYAFWSWICMIPAIIVYVAGGDAVRQGMSEGRIPWNLVIVVGVIVVFLLLVALFLKRKNPKIY